MLGPDVRYPCIAYTEEGSAPVRMFYAVKPSRARYFRFWRWPPQDWYVPGGILDSEGRHFRVTGLSGWKPRPSWLVRAVDDTFGGLIFRLLCGSNFRLELSAPSPLSLDAFKHETSLILYGREPRSKTQKRDEKRTGSKLMEAASFEDVVRFADWFQKTDGGG